MTFLKGRKVNPFFQLAEALWILAGRADVEWLVRYNKNMGQFSDDGVHFNAPYGERLRSWNHNAYRGFVFNPFDQLADVYKKLLKDRHTRQAVASIFNPLFDNDSYGGKDTPCNLTLAFKIRNDKLDLTLFNRSNDAHWGLWGANLCQFSTIQEVVASWLGVEVGTYTQITDSLHVYLEDYGARETDNILAAYGLDLEHDEPLPDVKQFIFPDEPRIKLGFQEFEGFLDVYFNQVDPQINDDELVKSTLGSNLIRTLNDAPDEYFKTTLLAMLAYRAHRVGNTALMVEVLGTMKDSSWKVSCLHFLYNKYKNDEAYNELFQHYESNVIDYIKGV
ncbi:Thymidylate synthase [compost metagenome]